MSIMVSLLVCAIVGAAGTVAGWFIRQFIDNRNAPAVEEAKDSSDELNLSRSEMEALVKRLKDTAENIAFDVEEHNESMEEANSQLQSDENPTTEAVVAVLSQVIESNRRLQKQLESAEDKLFEQARVIQSQALEANTDALTLVSNRRAFDSEMAIAEERFRTDGKPVSVMMLDVDHFKKFNDSYGHQAGDEVLKNVARTLRRKVKRNGQVCRYGGEEFAVIFHGKAVEDCMDWAELARSELARTRVDFEGQQFQVTASGGLAQIQELEASDMLIGRADDALYAAKEAGRNCGFWNDGSKNHKIESKNTPLVSDVQESELEPAWAAGLSNKVAFDDELTRRLAEWKRGGPCMSLGILRVDNWIDLYTTQGEQTADLVLKATAQFLKASVRDMDNVAVIGEGLFAMLFPSARLENTVKIGERLRSAISRCEIPADNGKLNFTVSVGIAESIASDGAEDFVGRARRAMSDASSLGGNLCFAHDGEKPVRITKHEAKAEASKETK